MTRVTGGGISTRNPFGPAWSKGVEKADNLGQQVQDELFGKKKPRVLDGDDKDTAAQMARLHAYRKKLARLAGDDEDAYDLVLAEGTIAMIDAKGLIYVGRSFLLQNAEKLDLLVGVIAHEIGHRPKRWEEHRAAAPRTKDELHELCRLEETYADFFAGRALAELGLSCEPLCELLVDLEKKDGERPHPEYFPAKLRAEVIREGFTDAKRQADVRKKMFPELARHVSAKNDLGSG
jgi:hypothetical protein